MSHESIGPTESWASSAGRRRIMQGNRPKDTRPELAVRRLLHADGLRYRVSYTPLPGLRRSADVAFPKQRVAVFIDGCFWHGCPEHGRTQFNVNGDYWPAKIRKNRSRDQDTNERLTAAGWLVLRFWEHEAAAGVARAVAAAVRDRGRQHS